MVETPAPTEADLADGGVLLKVLCMSADPYLRGGLKEGTVPRPMAGFVSGRVVASKRVGWEAWVAWARVLAQRGAARQAWPDRAWDVINLGLVRQPPPGK